MNQSRLPKGWDEARVQAVCSHYEVQSDDEAAAEDEAILADDRTQTIMEVPKELVSVVRELIARHNSRRLQHV
jgi:hypothetical protein